MYIIHTIQSSGQNKNVTRCAADRLVVKAAAHRQWNTVLSPGWRARVPAQTNLLKSLPALHPIHPFTMCCPANQAYGPKNVYKNVTWQFTAGHLPLTSHSLRQIHMIHTTTRYFDKSAMFIRGSSDAQSSGLCTGPTSLTEMEQTINYCGSS